MIQASQMTSRRFSTIAALGLEKGQGEEYVWVAWVKQKHLEVCRDDVRGGSTSAVHLDLKLHPCCVLGRHRNQLQPVCRCVVRLQCTHILDVFSHSS